MTHDCLAIGGGQFRCPADGWIGTLSEAIRHTIANQFDVTLPQPKPDATVITRGTLRGRGRVPGERGPRSWRDSR